MRADQPKIDAVARPLIESAHQHDAQRRRDRIQWIIAALILLLDVLVGYGIVTGHIR